MSGIAAARLADAAGDLCIEAGVGGLTMRALADRVGVTPPAVVYHFRNRDRILLAALGALQRRIAVAYDAIGVALSSAGDGGFGAEAVFSAALVDVLARTGRSFAASDEIARTLAISEESAGADAVFRLMSGEAQAFWAGLPCDGDVLDAEARMLCGVVAAGLVPFAMLDGVAVRRNAQIIQLMSRLVRRLTGQCVDLMGDRTPLALLEDEQRPDGKQQIVEATIRLSGRLGIAGLTHRNIAAEAELSAAATTYFYPTKEDIVRDAARAVQVRAVNDVLAGDVPPPQFLSRIILDENCDERNDIAALTAFMNAATHFGEFDYLAETFRNLRGLAAVSWLHARGYAEVDRLDGIIWSAATTILTQRALRMPRAARAEYLDTTSDVWLRRIFDRNQAVQI